jgi:hypothetical protein
MKRKTVTVKLQKSIVLTFLHKFYTYFVSLSHFVRVNPQILCKDLKAVNASSRKHWNTIRFYVNTLRLMMVEKYAETCSVVE